MEELEEIVEPIEPIEDVEDVEDVEETLEYKDLKWNNADHTSFDATIKVGDSWLPYTCNAEDDGVGSQLWTIRDTLGIEEFVPYVPTLDEVKAQKLSELSSRAGCFENNRCDDMWVISSLGFKANADRRSQQNIEGLIKVLGDSKTMFKDYNDEFHPLGVSELQTLLVECIQNGLNLYSQKFDMQVAISGMETVEAVNSFEIRFEMADFTI